MTLAQQHYRIVPTPSHIIDGHFPDGNDGSAGIPLIWATIPSFLNNPAGNAFSVNLFSLYLTQPVDLTAVAAIASGTLSTGWTLDTVNGILNYSGSGVGSATIAISAIRSGVTVISNTFNISSVNAGTSDTVPPTIPTGVALVSKTANSAIIGSDAPMDIAVSGATTSGLKEVLCYRDGVLDGVTAISGGFSGRLSLAEFSSATPTRRYVKGQFVDLQNAQLLSSGGIPTAALVPGITACIVRVYLKDLVNATGTAYTMDNGTHPLTGAPTLYKCFQDITTWNNAHPSAPVSIIVMPIVRTFDSGGNSTDPAPTYLSSVSIHYTQGGGGYQMLRWDTSLYLPAWTAIMAEMGRLFGSNPYFAGIATQETATGGISNGGYTAAKFADGIIGEHTAIFNASANIRGFHYFNQMQGDGLSANKPVSASERQRVIEYLVSVGFWVGGPDILPLNSGLVSQVYPFYPYNKGRLPRFCAMQNNSYTTPFSDTPKHTLKDYTDWALNNGSSPISGISGLPNGLDGLEAIIWTYRTQNNYSYNDATASPIALGTSYVSSTYVPPTSSTIPAGTLVQSGPDYTITSYGNGIGPTSDEWSPGRVAVTGNFDIVGIINSITGVDTSSAYGGIVIRETTDATARTVNLHIGPTRCRLEYRPSPSVAMIVVATNTGINFNSPCWMWINRTGNAFTAYTSLDGNVWTQIGSIASLPMNNAVYGEGYCASGLATPVTLSLKQFKIQNLSRPTHNFTGLSPGPHTFSFSSRDIALNESALSPAISVTI